MVVRPAGQGCRTRLVAVGTASWPGVQDQTVMERSAGQGCRTRLWWYGQLARGAGLDWWCDQLARGAGLDCGGSRYGQLARGAGPDSVVVRPAGQGCRTIRCGGSRYGQLARGAGPDWWQ